MPSSFATSHSLVAAPQRALHLAHVHDRLALHRGLVLDAAQEGARVVRHPAVEGVAELPIRVAQVVVAVRVGELVGGDVSQRLVHLRAGEHAHWEQHGAVEHQEHRDVRHRERPGRRPALAQARDRDEERDEHRERLQHEEKHEIAKVLLADDVAHPRAVVVETLHAPVRHGAVLGAPGLDDLARGAKGGPVPGSELGVFEVRVFPAAVETAAADEAADAARAAVRGAVHGLVPGLGAAARAEHLRRVRGVHEPRVRRRHAVHQKQTGARREHDQPRPRGEVHVHVGHAVRQNHGVHEQEHQAEDEREARHGHALVVEERAGRFPAGLVAQTLLVVRQKAAEALVALVRRQLRRRAPLRVRRLQQREPARLREHVRSLAFAPDRRPVQGRAPLLVLPRDVRVAEEQ
mmetsp:Transcript_1379/g.5751  ORF Transcript_1379/g.5751 Transcript_1379/m.5751 type:complete len:406 (-) Transcript_1379:641-1858(-)